MKENKKEILKEYFPEDKVYGTVMDPIDKAYVTIQDDLLGEIDFFYNDGEIKCENLKDSDDEYISIRIFEKAFDEIKINIYIKTLKKIYEMKDEIFKEFYKEVLEYTNNSYGLNYTLKSVKNYAHFSIEIHPDVYINNNGSISELINFYVFGNICDKNGESLLDGYGINANISEDMNFKISFGIVW